MVTFAKSQGAPLDALVFSDKRDVSPGSSKPHEFSLKTIEDEALAKDFKVYFFVSYSDYPNNRVRSSPIHFYVKNPCDLPASLTPVGVDDIEYTITGDRQMIPFTEFEVEPKWCPVTYWVGADEDNKPIKKVVKVRDVYTSLNVFN